MNEQKLAQDLIFDANNSYKQKITEYPQILIDKEEYNKYDITILSSELEKFGFSLVDGINAPEPFSLFPIEYKKRKWFIFKKI